MSGSVSGSTSGFDPEGSIRVFIVEDHHLVRRVMGKWVGRTPGLVLCGEAASAEVALEKIPECRPRLALVDISLPGMTGIELIHILHEKYPDLWLLALSAHDKSLYGEMAVGAGAREYIMKDKVEQVQEAIGRLLNGRS
jgi:DNA-binding NarL/FixJ family response regulator